MHATFRRLQVRPGAAADVGALIQAEYVPLVSQVAGFVSYTLVDLGDDQVSSLGVFETEDGAREANDRARQWVADRLAEHVASPLEAHEGAVLVRA
jgi:hypothetical protein